MQMGDAFPQGFQYLPGYFSEKDQRELVGLLREFVAEAPLFTPVMPRTGKEFSVRMTNLGDLGWVSDLKGYRYQAQHPVSGRNWPAIPEVLINLWQKVGHCAAPPEACLVNYYAATAKMGMHQDRDEKTFDAPVVSVSLGDAAIFKLGGVKRGGPTKSLRLQSGDVVVLGGDARLCYHGIDRIQGGSSSLLKDGGRLNLTLRRVSPI
ncbi:alpha-ketoglutarate-dependent dioxygenase AlkB [Pseudovibrio sp. Tun.PSC04-5.I4]|uniref:alpha-ketoglutarate-dependent dioxygenase AlkB family protein n=1 Tax=Pseudovibrio sp. Tun.PSC04-5.I4 TaxID=1798213 RepID=UPI000884861C|nr:alpha-ketoglutarate-dependent dioxygenase AlkB [Pseudovibrio sp. Tun.PSC04-5.I4]SDR24990.1 DNA-N1-methyladenine dioxygenase [Pseudovibrio sp. Tun.PSC04-5.I4]